MSERGVWQPGAQVRIADGGEGVIVSVFTAGNGEERCTVDCGTWSGPLPVRVNVATAAIEMTSDDD